MTEIADQVRDDGKGVGVCNWNDMPRWACWNKKNSLFLLRVHGKVVILQAVGRGNGMKNQRIIKT